jgi:hypothetical protein
MAASGPRKRLALDTNVLLDLDEPKDFAQNFRETFSEQGLHLVDSAYGCWRTDALSCYGNAKQRKCADRALVKISEWGIKPFDPPIHHLLTRP